MLKLNETESLLDSEIGHRNYKKNYGNKAYKQVLLDLQNKNIIKSLIEQTLKNIYSEIEAAYIIKLLKNKNYND